MGKKLNDVNGENKLFICIKYYLVFCSIIVLMYLLKILIEIKVVLWYNYNNIEYNLCVGKRIFFNYVMIKIYVWMV